ncbi:hypothetical protein, partial [Paenibacillus graminis]
MRPEFEQLLKSGLYHKESIPHSNERDAMNFLLYEVKYDCYCPMCGKESLFIKESQVKPTIGSPTYDAPRIGNKTYSLEFYCTRSRDHCLLF